MPRVLASLGVILMSMVCVFPVVGQTLPPVRASGETITVTPSRIILGALSYGAKEPTMLVKKIIIQGLGAGKAITDIDLSHAEGVKVLSKQSAAGKLIIVLGIDIPEIVARQPFGQFIKKIIRLETNLPEEPQITVSIAGWVSINDTQRNFNRYNFDGSERWQGWFANPNVAGAVLGPISLFLIGGMGWACRDSLWPTRWLKKAYFIIIVTAVLGLLILLALTYSRGAWVAFVSGALAMLFFRGPLRKVSLVAILLFGFIVLALPSGLKRVGTYVDLQGDLSIANRDKLWTGALQIMGTHPLAGVGEGHFASIFERDFQTFNHTAKNSTAVSDYLTFGSEHGLVFLGIILGLLVFLAVSSFRNALLAKSLAEMTITSCFIAVLISSAFSTLWFCAVYDWIFGFLVLALLSYLTVRTLRADHPKLLLAFNLVRLSAYIGGVSLMLAVAAFSSLCFLPTQRDLFKVKFPDGRILTSCMFEPRWCRAKGTIVYFRTTDEEIALFCHSTLRPLSALGWNVIELPDGLDQADTAFSLGAMHQLFPGDKIFVSGDGNGARTAWRCASKAGEGNINAGAGFDFMSPDLNPTVDCPFLVFQSLYDDCSSPNTAIRIQRGQEFSKSPLSVVLDSNDTGYFLNERVSWLNAINSFFSRH